MPPESLPNEPTRLRAAVQDACAHGQLPCHSCQVARVLAVVEAVQRERHESLREIKERAEHGGFHTEDIAALAATALEGHPRDTRFDSAVALLARCHTALRRVKVPRSDPDFMQEVVAFLHDAGIDVSPA